MTLQLQEPNKIKIGSSHEQLLILLKLELIYKELNKNPFIRFRNPTLP